MATTAWVVVLITVTFAEVALVTYANPPPLVDGVTVTVAVTGALVAFVAVKEAILPAPLAANPIDAVLFVQLNIVPATVPVKLTAAVEVLLQTTWLAGCATSGVGLTVTVAVIGIPLQVTPAFV